MAKTTKFLFALLISLLPILVQAQSIPVPIGEWRTHLPYRNAQGISIAGDIIYCVANVSFFAYDKPSSVVTRYDKVSGLSDVGVALASFDPQSNILLVAYDNTNIDLLIDAEIINISDIKRKTIQGAKEINAIYFRDSLAYLATSFGIVVLDLERQEINDTYVIGSTGNNTVIYEVTSDDDRFYAATDEGIRTALINATNLSNFQEWEFPNNDPRSTIQASHIINYNGSIIANIQDTLFRLNGNSWEKVFQEDYWKIINVDVSENKIVLAEHFDDGNGVSDARIGIISDDDSKTNVSDSRVPRPQQAILDNNRIWVADLFNGLTVIENNESQTITPNGPFSFNVSNMSIADNELWVAPGGVDAGWVYTFNRDGFYAFQEEWWVNQNQFNNSELQEIINIYAVLSIPNSDRVYYGSMGDGLIEFEDGVITRYDQYNSILGNVPGDPSRTNVAGLALDRDGHVWITNYGATSPVAVKKQDGTWNTFTVQIDNQRLGQILIDDFNQKWMTIPTSNSQGLLVFNHGQDIDDTGDGDSYKIMTTSPGNGNLPTNDVISIVNDLDGEIWVGTAEGIAVFYCPSSVFSERGCDAQQIIVTQDGFAGNLLESESINTIAVDGANRKWVGTNNGVWLLSPDGLDELAFFDEDNSPLLSNNITDISIDHSSGEVFIGTQKGLISFMGDALGADDDHGTVLVFPNPVKENYEGPIAIRGLANDADVKITDINGILIYQTTAFGGQAIWNGRDPNGRSAKTGVYLIFSSNEDGSSTHVAKILVIK